MSSTSKGSFVLRFRRRNVLVFHDQCPHYSDVLALVRTTFSSLQHTKSEDIAILGSGTDCPWYGNVELTERAWESFCSQLAYATVTLKQEREQLEREEHETVNSKSESAE